VILLPQSIDNDKAALAYAFIGCRIPQWQWYTGIHSDTWRGLLGSNYKETHDFLLDRGLIEKNNSYSTTGNSEKKRWTKSFKLVGQVDHSEYEFAKSTNRKKMFEHFGPSRKSSGLVEPVTSSIGKIDLSLDDVRDVLQDADMCVSQRARAMLIGGLWNSDWRGRAFEDAFSKRVHSPVSMMPRIIRKELTLDGEELAQVDAHASQVFLVSLQAGDQEAIDQCAAGTFWQSLGASTQKEKDKIKEEVFRQMYGGKSDALTAKYPTLAAFVKKSGGRELCRQAQKLEREIFVNTVLKGLYKDKFFAVPIHDCVMCRKSDEEEVKDRIRSAFSERFKVVPFLA
jgi:hypothetical protein